MHKVPQESGATDEVGFRQVVKAAIDNAVHGFALFRLISEYAELADSEKDQLIRVLADQVSSRVLVIISIIHHSWEVARVEAVSAVQIGPDTSMVLSPFFPWRAAMQTHERGVIAVIPTASTPRPSNICGVFYYARTLCKGERFLCNCYLC